MPKAPARSGRLSRGGCCRRGICTRNGRNEIARRGTTKAAFYSLDLKNNDEVSVEAQHRRACRGMSAVHSKILATIHDALRCETKDDSSSPCCRHVACRNKQLKRTGRPARPFQCHLVKKRSSWKQSHSSQLLTSSGIPHLAAGTSLEYIAQHAT